MLTLLDNVVVIKRAYGMYEMLAGINDVDCRKANLNADFSLNTDNVTEQTDETPMTSNLTQKGMISIFAKSIEGDFY